MLCLPGLKKSAMPEIQLRIALAWICQSLMPANQKRFWVHSNTNQSILQAVRQPSGSLVFCLALSAWSFGSLFACYELHDLCSIRQAWPVTCLRLFCSLCLTLFLVCPPCSDAGMVINPSAVSQLWYCCIFSFLATCRWFFFAVAGHRCVRETILSMP